MEKIKLVVPSLRYDKQIWNYKQDFFTRGESLAGGGTLERVDSVKAWLEDVKRYSNVATCPSDRVPSSLYLAIRESDDTLVGMIDIRHHINHPILSTWGGHIGYSVLSSQRGKGYAKEMLRLSLHICKHLGIDKILITCDENNLASRKTILANGGIYEQSISVDGKITQRYWINL